MNKESAVNYRLHLIRVALVATLTVHSLQARADIVSTSWNALVTGQTLTGYTPTVTDALNLVNSYSTTLDWHSWGSGTASTGTLAAPTNSMLGGAGIGEEIVLGGVFEFQSNTHFTTVGWDWSDGTPVTMGDHVHNDGDNDAGIRVQAPNDNELLGTISFTFAADPTGAARAATLLLRRDRLLTISAIQGTSAIPIDTSREEGLVTIEYNGTQDLTIELSGNAENNNGTVARGFAATLSATAPPITPTYLQRVVAYADAMVAHAPDDVGSASSPLLASGMLRGDTSTPSHLPQTTIARVNPPNDQFPSDEYPTAFQFNDVPAVLMGGDQAHKINATHGANVGDDQQLYQLLYRLSDLNGDSSYAAAADASLGWFFNNAQDGTTDMLYWGEHSSYDFHRDIAVQVDPSYRGPGETYSDDHLPFGDKHEFQHRTEPELWERFEALGQTGVGPGGNYTGLQLYAQGIWDQHLYDDNGRIKHSRHGHLFNDGNALAAADEGGFPRHAGYFFDAWSVGYETASPSLASLGGATGTFRDQMASHIDALVDSLDLRIDEIETETGTPYLSFEFDTTQLSVRQNMELTSLLERAAGRIEAVDPTTHASTIQKMRDLAARIDAHSVTQITGTLSLIDAQFVQERFERTPGGTQIHVDYGEKFLAGIEAYMTMPDLDERDLGKKEKTGIPGRVPQQYADVITSLLAAAEATYSITSDSFLPIDYVERARYFADLAIGHFLDGASPLPRAIENSVVLNLPYPHGSTVFDSDGYYLSYNGGDDLMLALFELALIDARIPGDYDRDGDVDQDDYIVWNQSFGSTTDSMADGNFDGVVDAADYTLWRDHLGMSTLLANTVGLKSVPEPNTALLLLGPALVLLQTRLL